MTENQLVMEFLADHKEVVSGIIDRAVKEEVAEILEKEHEKVLETVRLEVSKAVTKVIKHEYDYIRLSATEKICEEWLSQQCIIDGTLADLRGRMDKLEKDQDDADWWKRGPEDEDDS